MDSLTQVILGAAVGEAALGRKVGNKAMLYGAIAGTIPDLDALAGYFTDTITAIEVHRSFSHSVIFSVLAAPVLGKLISWIERNSAVHWKQWSILVFWALLTHPLLDAFTTWGTQLFWPLDSELAFKSIFVIDPLYTLPFLIFMILTMRQNKNQDRRRKYLRLGLIVSTSYLVLTLIFKGVAYQHFEESLDQQGILYQRMDTRPTPFNTILWAANIEVEDAYLVGYYSLFDDQLVDFTAYPKNHHDLGPLKKDKNVQRLIEISNGWYTITRSHGFLFFNDLRFGKLNPSDPGSNFAFSYKLVPQAGTIRAVEVEKSPENGGEILTALLKRIEGN